MPGQFGRRAATGLGRVRQLGLESLGLGGHFEQCSGSARASIRSASVWPSSRPGSVADARHLLGYYAVIVVNAAFQTGFRTFVLSNYMKALPTELTEAAMVDGAGVWNQYASIIMLLCRPALAALGPRSDLRLQRLLGRGCLSKAVTGSPSPPASKPAQPVLLQLQPDRSRGDVRHHSDLDHRSAAARPVRGWTHVGRQQGLIDRGHSHGGTARPERHTPPGPDELRGGNQLRWLTVRRAGQRTPHPPRWSAS